MSKLGVLLIHGLGGQPPNYGSETIDKLQERIEDKKQDPRDVVFHRAYWAPELEDREQMLFDALDDGGDLNFQKVRRELIISGFGDAIAYAGTRLNTRNNLYRQIHTVVAESLNRLRGFLDRGDESPLVIMAHSLGSVIASNYLWDAQKADRHKRKSPIPVADSPFSKGRTLAGMITFGCNLPLFTLAVHVRDIMPIAFPGADVYSCFPGVDPETVKSRLKWLNFYDPDDLLGYPLKPLNQRYDDTVTEDIGVQTGWVKTAQTDYWTDRDLIKPAADQLVGLLKML